VKKIKGAGLTIVLFSKCRMWDSIFHGWVHTFCPFPLKFWGAFML